MMVEFYEENGREIIPAIFESNYEELKDSFESQGYWNKLELDSDIYSNSELVIDFEFMAYHENSLKGELNLRVYGENIGDHEEAYLSEVRTSEALRILGEAQEDMQEDLADIPMNSTARVEAD